MDFLLSSLVLFLPSSFLNICQLSLAEMEADRQRVRTAATHKKEEEKRAKGKEGTSLSAPKAISSGSAKRKANGKDDHPSKKVAVTPRDAYPKKKSHLKLSRCAGKGMMTSTGPIVERPRRLLTHKDYVIEEVESLIKLRDVEPCAELRTEELGASALFDLTRVSLLSWLILSRRFPFID